MKLEIPLSVLRILAPFCSTDDTRESICGIAVTDGCAAATDGHRLLYCESSAIVARDVPGDKTALVNPSALAGLKVRVHPNEKSSVIVRLEGETAEEITAGLDCENEHTRGTLPQVRIGACVTLVEYPNWRRYCLSPIGETAVSAYTNGRYLAEFGEAAVRIAAYLGNSGSGMIRIRHGIDGKSPLTVDFDPGNAVLATFAGVLMPCCP
jgi:hypothetical protein